MRNPEELRQRITTAKVNALIDIDPPGQTRDGALLELLATLVAEAQETNRLLDALLEQGAAAAAAAAAAATPETEVPATEA